MKKWLIGLGIVLVVAVLGWANLRNIGGGAGDGLTVNTQVVEPKDLSFTVLAPATLVVNKEHEVRSQIQAPDLRLEVEVGDAVEAGQVLATVNVEDLRLAVVQAESNLAAARSSLADLHRRAETAPVEAQRQVEAAEVGLRQAEAALARVEVNLASQRESTQARLAQARASLDQTRLALGTGSARPEDLEAALRQMRATEAELAAVSPESAPQLQEAQLQVQSARVSLEQARLRVRTAAVLPEQIAAAEAQVKAAEAALADARAKLEQATFRSPIAGTVLAVPAREGQPVTPGTLIAVVARTDELKARIRVDEMEIGKVKTGQEARVTSPAYPDEEFAGQVIRIDPQGERSSAGTSTFYPVDVKVEARGKLRPNMNVDAEITAETREGVLALPLEALLSDEEGGWYVWVVQDGKAVKTPVTPGLRTRTEVEITDGLNPGDEVVVGPLSTLNTLKDGQAVQPQQPEEEGEGA